MDSGTKENFRKAGLKPGLAIVGITVAVIAVLEFALVDAASDLPSTGFGSLTLIGGSALLATTGLAVGLAACAFTLLRRANRQHAQLLSAQKERHEINSAYQQVLQNLPVGLFTYADGEFGYTNWSWDEQLLRKPGEPPVQAFLRSLHPEDRKQVLHELERCSRFEEPLHLNTRLVNEFLEEKHILMRGGPVYEADGTFRHLLGFNIDITEAAQANKELQRYNLEVEHKNAMLTRALSDLEANFTAMVESLVKAVEAKDPYTAGHSERVMQYSVKVGEHFGLNPHELKILRMGTLIHDIGKIGIPDDILTKPAGLTNEEFEIIKKHPEVGFEMIQGIPMLRECAPIVRFHHERLDGTGYPLGLKGEDISFLVRISAVADVFDAMTSNRAYRKGLPARVAIDELRREASLHRLDRDIVEAFAHAISREPAATAEQSRAA